jgi:hypothetical protein
MTSPNRIRVFFPPYNQGDVVELSPYGRTYSDSTEFIAREERSVSGKLHRDVIAQKKTFTLKYNAIDPSSLDVFATLVRYHHTVPLYLELTYGLTQAETYTVLINPYSRDRILAVMGGLWGNVTITFTEV